MGLFDIFRRKERIVRKSLRQTTIVTAIAHIQDSDKPAPRPRPLNFMEERIKYFYEHPEALIDIEFSNRTKQTVNIWVELACVSIDLNQETEYKITTHDRYFRMEFDENNRVVFYLQYSFGFKLYKRPISKNNSSQEWQLDYDCSDIN